MRSGVRVALDLGERRIGVARCDPDAIMALPVGVIDARNADWICRVADCVKEHAPLELIIGNPVSLRGTNEIAAAAVHARAEEIALALPSIPVRLVDERLSTAGAMRQLLESGKSTREARHVIDAQAAVSILEFALEYERRTGQPAGESL